MAQSNGKHAHVTWVTWVALAGLIVVAATWISFATLTPQSKAGAAAAPSSSASDTAVKGRSDAWFLPDEELLGFVSVPGGPFLMGSDKAIDPLGPHTEWNIGDWMHSTANGTPWENYMRLADMFGLIQTRLSRAEYYKGRQA